MEQEIIVIALGGNMILRRGQKGSFEEQMENTRDAARTIADLYEQGYKIILTSGNGPQVGNILAQQGYKDTPSMPLYVAGAMSQGQIGYMISMTLQNEFKRRGLDLSVVTICTRVIVDKDDPAFKKPTKPIGRFYTKEQADEFNKIKKGPYKNDADRGYRLFVASPWPQKIVEKKEIMAVVNTGALVYCTGGGGIPIIEKEDGMLEGAIAVIDKDRATSILAEEVNAKYFIVLTDVSNAYLNYNKENSQKLGEINLELAMQYYKEGHFIEGSMGPKVEAAIKYVKKTQGTAIITNPETVKEAIKGTSGTRIVP